MARFIDVKGTKVNVERIKYFYYAGGELSIKMTGGEELRYEMDLQWYSVIEKELQGDRVIKQVFEPTRKVFAVYEDSCDENFDFFAEKVDFLAVTENGEIIPIGFCEGEYYLEDSSNYKGLYTFEDAKENFSRIDFSEKSKGVEE